MITLLLCIAVIVASGVTNVHAQQHEAVVDTSRAVETHERGRLVYENACSTCHETGSSGAPRLRSPSDWTGYRLEWRALLKSHAVHGLIAMPPRKSGKVVGSRATEDAVDYMADVMEATQLFGSPVAPDGGVPASSDVVVGTERRVHAYERGKSSYERYCSSCHDDGSDGAPRLGIASDWLENRGWRSVLKQHAVEGLISMPPVQFGEPPSVRAIEDAVDYMADVLQAFQFLEISEPVSSGRSQ